MKRQEVIEKIRNIDDLLVTDLDWIEPSYLSTVERNILSDMYGIVIKNNQFKGVYAIKKALTC